MRALLKAILAALGEPPAPTPGPLVLRVAKPAAWTREDGENLAEFLLSESGQKLCARARWLHLNAASMAVQTPGTTGLDAARGSAETLRFLHEMSGLKELPDLLPDQPARSEADEAETTPSLHSLLTHTHDAN